MLNWKKIIINESNKKYFKNIFNFIKNEIKYGKIILPYKNNIFNSFKYSNFNNIKVVIIGQDPYYKLNQANGIAFSVNKNIFIPRTLINIYREIYRDDKINFIFPNNGFLLKWLNQGVLLLNSVLTVELNKPSSHFDIGWEIFISNIIKYINFYKKKIIFLFLGKYSRRYIKYINLKNNYILCTSHPSPLSFNKGFYGCGYFSKINNILKKNNFKEIDWQI
ncbi:uracil-DNA glycosylase [Candidatus Nardonella dryophthoridicola]|uniref:uracil-DNA glycosylase n=1 Tax=Candidatus Nardonella dryophthoridicola TaxID=1971485 RepID=UPI001AD8610D|nr:uracil-DNA glycosylase [Candidatus Nardonella dryophthoridicola]QTJ62905.1 uracil-DNA glycosylase [Candidatus Nardonella dryophthoridicola]